MNQRITAERGLAQLHASALCEWRENVRDHSGSKKIEHYFSTAGWWWAIKKSGYHNNASFAWCGIFVAYCGLTPRYPKTSATVDELGDVCIRPSIASHILPSTVRIGSGRKWRRYGGTGRAAAYYSKRDLRTSAHEILRPGQFITVGKRKGMSGSHIVIVDKVYSDGTFDTIEGNGWGVLGDGSYGEGVIRRAKEFGNARNVNEIALAPVLINDYFDTMPAWRS